MTATALLAECARLGIAIEPADRGQLRVRYEGDFPAPLREAVRQQKAELLTLLNTRSGSGSVAPGTPPVGATLYWQDADGHPCPIENVFMWTWAGADRWHLVSETPMPTVVEDAAPWVAKWRAGKKWRKRIYPGVGRLR